MKANHNFFVNVAILIFAVLNFVKKQNESKSQPGKTAGIVFGAVLNFVKKQNESKSQPLGIRRYSRNCCFKLCQKTK